jgi:hypothetical protein
VAGVGGDGVFDAMGEGSLLVFSVQFSGKRDGFSIVDF